MTPYERATGRKPDLSKLRCFRETVWVKAKGAGKLDPKSKVARWLGIDPESKAYRVYWEGTRCISTKQNVRFGNTQHSIISIEGETKSARKKKTTRYNSKPDKLSVEGEKSESSPTSTNPTPVKTSPTSESPSVTDVANLAPDNAKNDAINDAPKPEPQTDNQKPRQSDRVGKPS
jgi:hypothetical protein